jgi:hypothetical protein
MEHQLTGCWLYPPQVSEKQQQQAAAKKTAVDPLLQPALINVVQGALWPVPLSELGELRVTSAMATWVYYLDRVERNHQRLLKVRDRSLCGVSGRRRVWHKSLQREEWSGG